MFYSLFGWQIWDPLRAGRHTIAALSGHFQQRRERSGAHMFVTILFLPFLLFTVPLFPPHNSKRASFDYVLFFFAS